MMKSGSARDVRRVGGLMSVRLWRVVVVLAWSAAARLLVEVK